jgi:DNA-binding MarR family transcriptional regulator
MQRTTNTPTRASITVSLPEFLVAGSDLQFRDFVADLFAAVAGMQALRRALAASVSLSASEFSVLLAIWHLQKKGCVGITAIANHLHAAAANITVEVSKLVRADLVRKTPHVQDSRAVKLALTTKGEATLNHLAPLLRRINDRLFAGNSPEAIASIKKFLRHVGGESAHAIRMAREH